MSSQMRILYDRQSSKILGLPSRKTGNKLVLSVEKLERRVALLENGRLEEYSVERKSSRNIVGSVYKGKVKNIEMGLKAMFVDIGFEKNAFLHFWDAIPAALDSGIEEIDRKSKQAASKTDHGKRYSEHLSGRLGCDRAGHQRPNRNQGPARHDQSEFRRALPGSDALQRSQRHLAQD
jgi:Ribonuclease G/E